MNEEQMILMEISAQLFAIKFEMFKEEANRIEFNRRIEEYSLKAEMNQHPDVRDAISRRLYELKFK